MNFKTEISCEQESGTQTFKINTRKKKQYKSDTIKMRSCEMKYFSFEQCSVISTVYFFLFTAGEKHTEVFVSSTKRGF